MEFWWVISCMEVSLCDWELKKTTKEQATLKNQCNPIKILRQNLISSTNYLTIMGAQKDRKKRV